MSDTRTTVERYLRSASRREVDPTLVVEILRRGTGLSADLGLVTDWLEDYETARAIEDYPDPSAWGRLIPDECPRNRATDWLLDHATELFRSCDWILDRLVTP